MERAIGRARFFMKQAGLGKRRRQRTSASQSRVSIISLTRCMNAASKARWSQAIANAPTLWIAIDSLP
jgi:hypothetical protein